jgi:hypothetical protein
VKGLAIKRFCSHTQCSHTHNRLTKLITQQHAVRWIDFHRARMRRGFRTVNTRHELVGKVSYERRMINHSVLKSREEFHAKRRRRHPIAREPSRWSFFDDPAFSSVPHSISMVKYVSIVRQRLQHRFGLPVREERLSSQWRQWDRPGSPFKGSRQRLGCPCLVITFQDQECDRGRLDPFASKSAHRSFEVSGT